MLPWSRNNDNSIELRTNTHIDPGIYKTFSNEQKRSLEKCLILNLGQKTQNGPGIFYSH
jgi:hypothetical protein